MGTSADDLAAAAVREVEELHAFFEEWLGGTGPRTDAALQRLETALGPDFSMVTPEGARLRRDDVTGWLRDAHGAKGKAGPFRIIIREPEVLHVAPPLVSVGYVEEQHQGEAVTSRRSTALFQVDARGVQWLNLHETWLPAPA